MLLGLYIRRFVGEWSWKRTLAVGLPAWLVGFAICFISFIVAVETDAQGVYPVEGPMGMAAVWETTWINDTASVALMTIGWILLFRKCTCSGRFYQRILLPVSKASYGMYLCHMIVLALVSTWLRSTLGTGLEGALGVWTTPLQIICTAFGTFIITAIFSTLMQRIPLVGKWIIG
jgi:peptidoglycan/LPS O-acetylase OafA/YrhL